MQVWIECPQLHWIGVWVTHSLMHEHVGKRVKIPRSKEIRTGDTRQVRQAYQHRTGWKKVYIKHTNTMEVIKL